MSIDDKYLTEVTRAGISNEKRYDSLRDLIEDLSDISHEADNILPNNFYMRVFKAKNITIKELDNMKYNLLRLRNKVKTQQAKNIVDEYIQFIGDISEGYWENVDTSREGT